jgi:hypothetical protein
VKLYELYGRGRIDQRSELRRAARQWLWLLAHAGDLRDPMERNAWAWRAGARVGRLEQSLRSRVLLP